MFKRYQPSGPEVDHPVPILTMGVITICILVFLGIHFQGDTSEAIERWGSVPAQRIWSGDYRGLISSVFVHEDPLHLIFNMYALWMIGAPVEIEIGAGRWLALVLGSAIVSSGAQLATGETGIGFSGVGYALFGFAWASRWQIDRFRRIISPQMALWFIIWLVGCWAGTLSGVMRVGNEAHLGGLLFGTLVGEIFIRKRHRMLFSFALALVCALSLLPVFWAPWTAEWATQQAMIAFKKGDYTKAEQWFLRSLHGDTNREFTWNMLGYLYAARGDQEGVLRAKQELQKLEDQSNEEDQPGFGRFMPRPSKPANQPDSR